MSSSTATFRVTASLAALAAVRHFVAATGARFGLQEDAVVDVVQAVDEAVTNIVTHGYGQHPGPVEIEMACVSGDLIVRLSDEAPHFDPTALPATGLAPHAGAISGGWGIRMMRTLTDRMSYRVLPAGGNELTLVKTLKARSP
jgi:serine/threonine-protein kinase RsbW